MQAFRVFCVFSAISLTAYSLAYAADTDETPAATEVPPEAPIAPETAPPLLPEVSQQAPEAAPEIAPAPKVSAEITEPSTENQVTTLRTERRSRIPAFTLTRPTWGVSVTSSLKAFGGEALTAAQGTNPIRALQFGAEYQFPFLQAIGVLSAGPSVGIYPIFPATTVTTSPFSLWEVGGQVKYQARFFREQIIVPTVGYEAQYFRYSLKDGPSGGLIAQGPTFGLMFLLNWIEPYSAAELYINSGIARSYILAEMKSLVGHDDNLSLSGLSLFFGLRLEF